MISLKLQVNFHFAPKLEFNLHIILCEQENIQIFQELENRTIFVSTLFKETVQVKANEVSAVDVL